MKDAEFIQRAIPDELRDISKHPDTKLVAEAITVSLLEARAASRDEWTDAGAAKRINARLKAFYDGIFVPHLTEEDEQWNSLKEKASRAMPLVRMIDPTTKRTFKGWHTYRARDERMTGDGAESLIAVNATSDENGNYEATYSAQVRPGEEFTEFTASGKTPVEAARNAVSASGAVLKD